jgi:single-strand DNA-binding protein
MDLAVNGRVVTGTWAEQTKDGEALFLTVNVWRQQAANVAESLTCGARAVVTGRLRQRSYETREGEKWTVLEVEADYVAAPPKFASAKVTKASRSSGGNGGQVQADPWASDASGGYSDTPPF